MRRKAGGFLAGFSYESEHELALLVSDLLENGSGSTDARYSSDSDTGFSDLGHLVGKILFHQDAMAHESDLLSVVRSTLLLMNELDLCLINDKQCNASCIRLWLVKLLKLSGYDAGLCTSSWHGSDIVPGATSK